MEAKRNRSSNKGSMLIWKKLINGEVHSKRFQAPCRRSGMLEAIGGKRQGMDQAGYALLDNPPQHKTKCWN